MFDFKPIFKKGDKVLIKNYNVVHKDNNYILYHHENFGVIAYIKEGESFYKLRTWKHPSKNDWSCYTYLLQHIEFGGLDVWFKEENLTKIEQFPNNPFFTTQHERTNGNDF